MKAWYFSSGDRKLRYGDNGPIVVGETHSVDLSVRALELCRYGLHASERLIDALKYAPSMILYEVELSGQILVGDDKVCAEHRTYIREIDMSEILRVFVRKQALINIDKIRPYCTPEQMSNVMVFLTGEDTSEGSRNTAIQDVVKSYRVIRAVVRSVNNPMAVEAATWAVRFIKITEEADGWSDAWPYWYYCDDKDTSNKVLLDMIQQKEWV